MWSGFFVFTSLHQTSKSASTKGTGLVAGPQAGGKLSNFPRPNFQKHVYLLGTTTNYNHFDPPGKYQLISTPDGRYFISAMARRTHKRPKLRAEAKRGFQEINCRLKVHSIDYIIMIIMRR